MQHFIYFQKEEVAKLRWQWLHRPVFQWVCDTWFSLAEISFLSHHQRFAWGTYALPTWGEPSFPACLEFRGNLSRFRKKANLIPTLPSISLSEGGLRTGSLRNGSFWVPFCSESVPRHLEGMALAPGLLGWVSASIRHYGTPLFPRELPGHLIWSKWGLRAWSHLFV